MKKIKKALIFTICVFAVVLSTVSCTNSEKSQETAMQTPVPEITQTELPNSNTVVPQKSVYSSDSINEDMNVIAEYSYDMDNDGTEEKIVLASDVKKGAELDSDGHNRQLYIKDGDKYYILADQYVQLGNIEFEVMDYYKGTQAVPTVVVTYDTSSMLKLYAYVYDNDNNCYTERELYNSSNESENGINKMYSSAEE